MRTLAWLLVSVIVASLAPQTQDITGTWVGKRDGPGGEQELVWEFKVVDGKITGTERLPMGEAPIVDGKVDGHTFEFTVENEFFGEISRQVVKGEIVGDELRITLPPGGGRRGRGPGGAPGAGGAGLGGPPPGAGAAGPGGMPPGGGPPAAGGPGGGGRGGFPAGPVVARRGTPTPTYRATSINYKTLPKVELPALKTLIPNGLAKTPPMGWNSWNKFRTKIDDKTVREIADAMVVSGMRDAGYKYINIDDGWEWKRDDKGVLQTNPNFPDMKALADYVHGKGLKLGIYSSPGPTTCGGYVGGYGHEEIDAQTWADWGIDYLKYDWCSASRIWTDADMQAVYQRMGEAIRKTGRPIVYSICQYGRANVQEWGPKVGGNLWRTTFDIRDQYESMASIGFSQSDLAPFAAPGHWNDPDMLEIGNGAMSPIEYQTHMSLWAILAAPLIAGNDLRSMTVETKSILLNPEAIAIDQDPLGNAGARLSVDGQTEVWGRPLARNAFAVGLFNRGDTEAEMRVAWTAFKAAGTLRVRDVWAKADRGTFKDGFSAKVPPHGVVLIRASR
jgi:alpha-galactosidase